MESLESYVNFPGSELEPTTEDINLNLTSTESLDNSKVLQRSNEHLIQPLEQSANNSSTSVVEKKHHVCGQCSKSYKTISHLMRHILTHAKEKNRKVNGVFDPRYNLHHSNDSSNINPKLSTITPLRKKKISQSSIEKSVQPPKHSTIQLSPSLLQKNSLVCGQCNRSFGRMSHLKRHILTHTKEKKHICSVCNRAFAQKGNLDMHYSCHFSEKTHMCDKCDRSFSHIPFLKRHQKEVHGNEKRYACDVCEERFPRMQTLVRHYRLHTNEKPCVCSICQVAFARPHTLKQHYLTHTGEKPYACDQCDQRFAQKWKLTLHRTKHHVSLTENSNQSTVTKGDNSKSHICTQCNKCFRSKSFLLRHWLKHTEEKPHVCGLCNRAFAQKIKLDLHYYTHSKEDLVCDQCGRKFSHKNSLRRHWRVLHSEHAIFVCDLCDRTFKRKGERDRHYRSHLD